MKPNFIGINITEADFLQTYAKGFYSNYFREDLPEMKVDQRRQKSLDKLDEHQLLPLDINNNRLRIFSLLPAFIFSNRGLNPLSHRLDAPHGFNLTSQKFEQQGDIVNALFSTIGLSTDFKSKGNSINCALAGPYRRLAYLLMFNKNINNHLVPAYLQQALKSMASENCNPEEKQKYQLLIIDFIKVLFLCRSDFESAVVSLNTFRNFEMANCQLMTIKSLIEAVLPDLAFDFKLEKDFKEDYTGLIKQKDSPQLTLAGVVEDLLEVIQEKDLVVDK